MKTSVQRVRAGTLVGVLPDRWGREAHTEGAISRPESRHPPLLPSWTPEYDIHFDIIENVLVRFDAREGDLYGNINIGGIMTLSFSAGFNESAWLRHAQPCPCPCSTR
jgi:hypothetical protein